MYTIGVALKTGSEVITYLAQYPDSFLSFFFSVDCSVGSVFIVTSSRSRTFQGTVIGVRGVIFYLLIERLLCG